MGLINCGCLKTQIGYSNHISYRQHLIRYHNKILPPVSTHDYLGNKIDKLENNEAILNQTITEI